MGHVDHGKTTLLDAIRTTRVAEREAGGITQHIGAYLVPGVGEKKDKSIVFLDTPGHEAFTLMRARGAKVTDVVILVVAADDGVMPQTREAIDHAKAAERADHRGGQQDRQARRQPGSVEASARRPRPDAGRLGRRHRVRRGLGQEEDRTSTRLLEMILLVTDIGELKANPKRTAVGTVLETKLDRGRGPVATVLVQDGTLRVGDNVIAGPVVGRVRALIDDRGRSIKQAGPSTPVEMLGLEALPSPGDSFQSVTDPAKARQIATFRQVAGHGQGARRQGQPPHARIAAAADGEGGDEGTGASSSRPTCRARPKCWPTRCRSCPTRRREVKIIHSGVGAINESDVLLATASNAIIIGFNVRPDRNAADVAEREKVDIRHHSVIYTVTEEIQKAMTGLLEPTFKEVRLGVATVRDTFKVPKIGTIAGCMVSEGRITRSGDAQARLLRDNVQLWEGKIGSLKRFKDDVVRGEDRLRVRHRPPGLQRRQGRRRHRSVPPRARRGHRVSGRRDVVTS